MANLRLASFFVLLLALITGIFLRVMNVAHHGFYFDTIVTQFTWGRSFSQGGFLDSWVGYKQYLDYPPLNLAFLSILAYIGQTSVGFLTLLKSVYILADLALLGLIWWLLSLYKVEDWKKLLTLSFVFLYPGFWFVSGVWGQSDTLHAALVLFGFILLYQKNFWSWCAGGVVIALALWFKLQVLLVLAAFSWILIMLYGKQIWLRSRGWLLFLPLFLLPAAAGTVYLVWLRSTGSEIMTSWTDLAGASIVALFTFLTITFITQSKTHDVLHKFHVFFASFFATTLVVNIVFIALNPFQWVRTNIQPLTGGATFSGSANLNNGFIRWQDLFGFGQWYQVLGIIIVVVYLALMLWWLWSVSKNAQDSLAYVVLAIGTFILIYYIFGVGRVHSRYGHMGLVLLASVLPLLRLAWYQWVGMAGIFLFYLANQIGVYTSFSQNVISDQLRAIASLPVVENYWLIVVGSAISGLLVIRGLLNNKQITTSNKAL